jgi:hypothetical protein
MTSTRLRAALAILATIACVSGTASCGSKQSKEEDAKTTVETFLKGVREKNGKLACSVLSKKSIKGIEGTGYNCPTAFNKVGAELAPQVKGFALGTVVVRGDTATVEVKKAGKLVQPFRLIRESGKWKLAQQGG